MLIRTMLLLTMRLFLLFLITVILVPPNFAYTLRSGGWNQLRTPRPFVRRKSLVRRRVSIERPDIAPATETSASENAYTSYIASIRSCNLAGTINDGPESEIFISFGDGPNLVAVTGETGSGKSLLIAKAVDLLTGGKVISASLVSATENANTFVEMELCLSEPHLSMVHKSLTTIGLDSATLYEDSTSIGKLILRRELAVERERIQSVCMINGQTVSLKALRSISRPLLAVVDAAAAAAALAKQNSRMSIVDTGVPFPVLSYARLTRAEYRKCRGYRRRLENELSNRMLPVSMTGNEDDDKNIELLQHWIEELDVFENRMTKFCASVGGQSTPGSNLAVAAAHLSSTAWFDDATPDSINTSEGEAFSSALYSSLVDFREAVKSLEDQLESAKNARDALSSLSSPDSVITAIERTRNYLFDSTGNECEESTLSTAAERSHDLLNKVEEALKACTISMEDEKTLLENMRRSIEVSLEDIDIILGDWNTLARKHGMTPFALPACHKALRSELDGNVEARLLLPETIAAEAGALARFEAACNMLTKARQKATRQLSLAVSRRLPSLGMEGSTFSADLKAGTRSCTDASAYAANARLGVDSVDFLLLHGTADEETDGLSMAVMGKTPREKGGKVDVVASSGEKARILLAIECELPGSVGAANRVLWNDTGINLSFDDADCPPVAIIYDEIDAHVGGRAAVAMANMLADQASEGTNSMTRGQIVSITHSPSVAAIADRHILIQRRNSRNTEGVVPLRASLIVDMDRRKELARMASGDLAPDEAETFADALLRDGALRRK